MAAVVGTVDAVVVVALAAAAVGVVVAMDVLYVDIVAAFVMTMRLSVMH